MVPKLSIILPIYGVENYIHRCMDTVLNQTLEDIEVIMVDDQSPDNCPAICDEYAKKDTRVKVIHKENAGLGYARNSGIEIATGEYVAFLDSDDFVDLDAYQKLYEAAKRTNADAVFADSYVELPNGEWEKRQFAKEEKIISEQEINSFVLDMVAGGKGVKADRLYPMSVWRLLYRREVIYKNRLRFLSERDVVSEDLPFQVDFFKNAKSVTQLPFTFYHYCLNGSSLTSTFKKEKYDRFRKLYEILREKLSCLEEGNFRADRFLIYYTRYHIMDMVKSDYKNKKKLICHIVNDKVWEQIQLEYKLNYLPVLNRLFYWLVLHKCTKVILIYINLINIVKAVKGRR